MKEHTPLNLFSIIPAELTVVNKNKIKIFVTAGSTVHGS